MTIDRAINYVMRLYNQDRKTVIERFWPEVEKYIRENEQNDKVIDSQEMAEKFVIDKSKNNNNKYRVKKNSK